MRDLVQLGGWRGGGATSWDQSEWERSVMKMEEEELGGESSLGTEVSLVVLGVFGKMVSR